MRNEMARGFGHQPVLKCTTKFTRRYIEVDQEITSTITDIEGSSLGLKSILVELYCLIIDKLFVGKIVRT